MWSCWEGLKFYDDACMAFFHSFLLRSILCLLLFQIWLMLRRYSMGEGKKGEEGVGGESECHV